MLVVLKLKTGDGLASHLHACARRASFSRTQVRSELCAKIVISRRSSHFTELHIESWEESQ